MGLSSLLTIIAGISMSLMLGVQVVPSIIESVKIKKIENRTISNQTLIKDSIIRYIKLNKIVPKDLQEIKDAGLLKDHNETNLFGGEYSFAIDSIKGTLKIFTTIEDLKAQEYFLNSFKSKDQPEKTSTENLFETFYLLDDEVFNAIR